MITVHLEVQSSSSPVSSTWNSSISFNWKWRLVWITYQKRSDLTDFLYFKVCIALLVFCLAVVTRAQFQGNWPYWGNTAWNNPAWNPYWNGYTTTPYLAPVDARFAAQPYGWNWPNGAYNRYYGQNGYFGYYGQNSVYNPTGAYGPNGLYHPANVARSPVNPWGMPWATYGGAYNNYVREPSVTGTRHIAATPGSLHIVGWGKVISWRM